MKANKRVAITTLAGFLIGALFIVGLRFATYKSDNVHYHANFAMYINGQREEFKSFTFYEEVQACTSDEDGNPKHRVHMHNQQNDLVHVHAPAVTWGHFFANLGYSLGDSSAGTDQGVFAANEKDKLTFVLNGQQVSGVANRVINSEDRLLINFGNDDTKTITERFDSTAKSAPEFNGKYDPGGCSGSEHLTIIQRLKKSNGL